MKYKVYIQDNYVKTIEANNTGEALAKVTTELKNGTITFDETETHSIRLEPDNKWNKLLVFGHSIICTFNRFKYI